MYSCNLRTPLSAIPICAATTLRHKPIAVFVPSISSQQQWEKEKGSAGGVLDEPNSHGCCSHRGPVVPAAATRILTATHPIGHPQFPGVPGMQGGHGATQSRSDPGFMRTPLCGGSGIVISGDSALPLACSFHTCHATSSRSDRRTP